MTTSQHSDSGARRRRSRLRLLAALSVAAVLTSGVIGILNAAPVPAAAATPIVTITYAPTGPVLAAPAANLTAAREARERAKEIATERESAAAKRKAAAREPALTCEPAADARVVNHIIVNKNCPDLIAAKEASHRAWACQQGTITEGCGSINGPKPYEAQQRRRIAEGSVPVGGGYAPGTDEYDTCARNPVADVCGG